MVNAGGASGGVRRGTGIEGGVLVITGLSRAMRSLKHLLTLPEARRSASEPASR